MRWDLDLHVTCLESFVVKTRHVLGEYKEILDSANRAFLFKKQL